MQVGHKAKKIEVFLLLCRAYLIINEAIFSNAGRFFHLNGIFLTILSTFSPKKFVTLQRKLSMHCRLSYDSCEGQRVTEMKKVMKWVAIVILIPILLFLLVTILLYLPPVQNWAAGKVADYASEKTGMDISVGHVSLSFPLDLKIDDFKMIKDNDSIPGLRDTIADVGQLVVDVQLLPLFRKQVEVDALDFKHVKLNTNGFIDDLRIKGNVEHLAVECHGVDLEKSIVNVNTAKLDSARLEVCLGDSVPPDTTTTPTPWRIKLDQLSLARTDVTLRMPGDTMTVGAYLGKADVTGGDFDLATSVYQVKDLRLHNSKADVDMPFSNTKVAAVMDDVAVSDGRFDLENADYSIGKLSWAAGTLRYDDNNVKPVDGLDTSHLALSDISIDVDSLSYRQSDLQMALRQCSFREKSGLHLEQLTGKVSLDNNRVLLPDVYLKTPDSKVSAKVNLDLSTFDSRQPGKMAASVDGYLGKQDLMRVMGNMSRDFVRKWPNQPLAVKGNFRGNMQRMEFNGLNVELPTAFKLKASGYAANLSDPAHLKADVDLSATTSNLDFATTLLDEDTRKMIRIPNGITFDGNVKANGNLYAADFKATEGGGAMKAKVALDSKVMKYSATVDTEKFPLQHFFPNMGLSPLTAHIEADGQGTDFLSPSTSLTAKAYVGKFRYDKYDLDGMKATAQLSNGRLMADIDSHNPLLDGNVSFNALVNTKRLQGTVACDLNNADVYRLRLFDKPLVVAGCAHLDIDTDFGENHKVQGSLGDLRIYYNNTFFRPEDMEVDILTRRNLTHAYVNSGDFDLRLDANSGYKRITSQVERFTDELTKQMRDKHFDQAQLRSKLPDANIYLSSGKENFFVSLMEEHGIGFDNLLVDMVSSPVDGLNGTMNVNALTYDSITIDTVKFAVLTDSTGFKYNAQVRNAPGGEQLAFNALLHGDILENGASVNAKIYDQKDSLGLDLGAMATIERGGVMVNLTDKNPIIGYKRFEANDDNYIFLGDDKRLSAGLKLRSDDGTHLHLYTNDDNVEALQDLTLSVGKLDLGGIFSVLPFLPDVSGVLDGDFHVVQTPENLSVSSALDLAKLHYEGMNMGDISTEFVYMPNDDGSHHIDGVVSSNGNEVGALVGTYYPKDGGSVDADFQLARFPLKLANGFVPNQLFRLYGYAEGDLSIKGPLSTPDVNGELFLDSTFIVSDPYGMELRVAEDPVRIVGSNLLFENFEVYAHNNSPLNISGYFDFSNLNRMNVDLRMRAQNFQIINAKENMRSEAFGKAFVDFFGSMKGPLDAMSMRGRVKVLGATDMTYVLRDSPLSADTRLEELVKFVDFNDSTTQVVARPPLKGFDMNLTLSVDESAHIKCDLNADHSNYIDLVGGGDLRLTYNTIDNMRLTGRYTLSDAEMKYSLPVIPLKTFTIEDGSYIEFRGEPMNPTLHITATEHTKASVDDGSGNTRSVDFKCGVIISRTLNDMGLEFIIEAPEDIAINSELASMSIEERGKVAVTMLTTGMYLADGNTSGFTLNGALSSFLQNEINNITGNALRTLDFTVGVDNATDASGTMHTDYSFKFAKRFWNNRLRVIVGGRVSTGSEVANQNQSFFTNVSFEYRLSPTSNKYLRLYYDRDSYDWLEGDIGEYGGGFLWRRKLQHFKDIFNFKSEEQRILVPRDTLNRNVTPRPSSPADSIKTEVK